MNVYYIEKPLQLQRFFCFWCFVKELFFDNTADNPNDHSNDNDDNKDTKAHSCFEYAFNNTTAADQNRNHKEK